MKTQELIGKEIENILMEIKNFEYDGSIPLEESNSSILLNSGEIIQIPDTENVLVKKTISSQQKSIFYTKPKFFFSKFFQLFSDDYMLSKKNELHIKGKKIVGIYKYSEENIDFDLIDKYILELESGYLISEKTISPKGTGHTGIWIFTSKNDLTNKMGADLIKIYH